ncbi:MAG TPA: PQQ-dependent sugar dehydrogenase [Anaerolineae bacterium]|nr:PQQ-dependent sugar dehydrogenase [Anaerolineae bacterium]
MPTPTASLTLSPTATHPPPTRRRTPAAPVELQPIAGGPVLRRDDITLRKVGAISGGNVRLARNPLDGNLYSLHPDRGIFRVDLQQGQSILVIPLSEIGGAGAAVGMNFGPDGALYIVRSNIIDEKFNQAFIQKGIPSGSGNFLWETLARTEMYPNGGPLDHRYNGVAVSSDGKWVFVNAGARTDHGEVVSNQEQFPGVREVPLTAAILRLPADAHELVLSNDENALKPYVFARGLRNAYDPEFAPNGELFAGDNGPDADYQDELNWIRAGSHYGFPWRFGNQDNLQQFSNYDPAQDVRLHKGYPKVDAGTYQNDPTFPTPPPLPFTDPIASVGPDAAIYRADDGSEHNAAAEGKLEYTFTPHRSPLGLVFATDAKMPADLSGDTKTLSAFILSFGAALDSLSDKGQDLLHLTLTKKGDTYQAVTTQIARGFKNPVDAVMIENRLYVLEFGGDGALWELTFH